jgi:hypothetical protein
MELFRNLTLARAAILSCLGYTLALLIVWGSFRIVKKIQAFFDNFGRLQHEVNRLTNNVGKLTGEVMQHRLARPPPGAPVPKYRHRESLLPPMPPPLPGQTSGDWSDDHRETQSIDDSEDSELVVFPRGSSNT